MKTVLRHALAGVDEIAELFQAKFLIENAIRNAGMRLRDNHTSLNDAEVNTVNSHVERKLTATEKSKVREFISGRFAALVK